MKLAAAKAIAGLIPEYELSTDYIIPSALDTRVPVVVAKAVGSVAM
jgi:malate dehydrogenase (oxaloacetate-decarboxylating)